RLLEPLPRQQAPAALQIVHAEVQAGETGEVRRVRGARRLEAARVGALRFARLTAPRVGDAQVDAAPRLAASIVDAAENLERLTEVVDRFRRRPVHERDAEARQRVGERAWIAGFL